MCECMHVNPMRERVCVCACVHARRAYHSLSGTCQIQREKVGWGESEVRLRELSKEKRGSESEGLNSYISK